MEPFQPHSATFPQQGLTNSAGGCRSEPRSGDLMQGGHKGAKLLADQRQANKAMDNAIVGTFYASEVAASRLEVGSDSHILTRFDTFMFLDQESKKNNGHSGKAFDLSKSERIIFIKSNLANRLNTPFSATQEKNLDTAIGLFITKIEKRYKDCKRNMAHFQKRNKDWLKQTFHK